MIGGNYDAFPQPVLAPGNDDYEEGCSFTFNVADDLRDTNTHCIVPMKWTLVSKTLQQLLDDGKIVPVVQAMCARTSMNLYQVLSADQQQFELSMERGMLRKAVRVQVMMVATQAFYMPITDELNKVYFENGRFPIGKSDVLACTDILTLEINEDEYEKPLSSIFRIDRMDSQADRVDVNVDDDKVVISLRSELYELYSVYSTYNQSAMTHYVNGVIVLPALVEALAYVVGENNEESEYSEKRWFKVLVQRLNKLGVDPSNYDDSLFNLADRVCEGVTLKALKQFDAEMNAMNNDEEMTLGSID